MGPGFAGVLVAAAGESGIELTAGQVERCARFAGLVLEGNKRLNLTSLVSAEEMAVKHFVDSFSCLKIGTWPEGGRSVDVGTGAGFPGVALAILRPDMRWVLLDALGKRVEFLKGALQGLGLHQVQCVHGRAEEMGRKEGWREGFDVAVARAVAPLPELLEYCLPLVRRGGGCLAMKGPEGAEEIAQAERAAGVLGAALEMERPFQLPGGAGARLLLWYTKERDTPGAYPRRAGIPHKRPL